MNHIKTLLLMVFLTIIFIYLGGLIAGDSGVIIAFVLALAINFFAYWSSDRLAIMMTRSKPLAEEEAPDVYRALRELTARENLPMPRVYIMPTDQPNAFAAGRNPQNSVVAVTRGILQILSYQELKGVLAHELAHIKNRDILINTIAAVMAGALVFISRMGMWGMMFGGSRRGGGAAALIKLALLIFAPIAALLIRMAISRTREYQADASGAMMAQDTEGLASALQKMESYARRRPLEINAATSHMFIVNPLSAKNLGSLFSTHPPVQERVKKLRDL